MKFKVKSQPKYQITISHKEAQILHEALADVTYGDTTLFLTDMGNTKVTAEACALLLEDLWGYLEEQRIKFEFEI